MVAGLLRRLEMMRFTFDDNTTRFSRRSRTGAVRPSPSASNAFTNAHRARNGTRESVGRARASRRRDASGCRARHIAAP